MARLALARPAAALAAGLAVFVCDAGCGSRGVKVYPVRGQVLFDGKPAGGATVVFHPTATDPKSTEQPPTPTGTVEADGSFTLMTHPYGAGAPAGEYLVAIVWLDRSKRSEDRSEERAVVPNKLPARY